MYHKTWNYIDYIGILAGTILKQFAWVILNISAYSSAKVPHSSPRPKSVKINVRTCARKNAKVIVKTYVEFQDNKFVRLHVRVYVKINACQNCCQQLEISQGGDPMYGRKFSPRSISGSIISSIGNPSLHLLAIKHGRWPGCSWEFWDW